MITPLTKEQWLSVLRNSIFAAISTFLSVVVTTESLSKAGLYSAAISAVMAAIKIIEKAFTPNS